MAESDGEDRTEDPTEKRKRDSREEGQLPRSRELGTVAVMLSGVGGLLMYGAFLGGKLLEVMRSNFSLRREEVMDERFMGTFLLASGKAAMIGMLPMIALVVIAAIVGHIALGGFLFSG